MRTASRFVPVILLAALAIAYSGQPAFGASFTVDSTTDAVDANPGDGLCADADGKCTLRAAIMETNAMPGADEITVPAGTYTLTIPGAGEDASVSGDIDVTQDLVLRGVGASNTVIDGNALDRVIHINGAIHVEIGDLKLRNGAAGTSTGSGKCNPFTEQENGGGICNGSGDARLEGVVIERSSASRHGSAIFNTGTMEVHDSNLTDNTGDAIVNGDPFNSGTILLAGAVVSNNGGGIRNYARATVTDSSFTSNIQGIENLAGTLTMTGGSVAGNSHTSIVNRGEMSLVQVSVSGNGSGISNIGTPATLTVRDSTISGNASGGIYNDGPTVASVEPGATVPPSPAILSLINVSISGNSGANAGGLVNLGKVEATNVTIAFNSSGIRSPTGAVEAAASLVNTIVALNTEGDCAGEVDVESRGHNLDTDGSCGLTAIGDISRGYVLMGELGDNGGPTKTHALKPSGCPSDACIGPNHAVDNGDAAACPSTDQRGQPRPFDGDGDGVATCDIGAYEMQVGPWTCAPPCNAFFVTATPTPSPTPKAFPPTGGSRPDGGRKPPVVAVGLIVTGLSAAGITLLRRRSSSA